MNESTSSEQPIDIKQEVAKILNLVEQEREKEIISRRFGLYDRKETLEQIGELLGITRERVRQLEKAILAKLKNAAADEELSNAKSLEKLLTKHLAEMGRVARIDRLSDKIHSKKTDQKERAHIAFIAALSVNLCSLSENDHYHHGVAIADAGDEKQVRSRVDEIVEIIKLKASPVTVDELHNDLSYEHPSQVEALASLSKNLAQLNGKWGLIKWPTVNPRNIRDKIYVILETNAKPMHFSQIAESIKSSEFKRKDVTTQAIHNELIKDSRFILIGRGIYALADWGYNKGTVSEIIENVLKDAKTPLHRDEIVRRVLAARQVKETTILLNLQSKPQFKRVAKATYTIG